MRTTWVKAAGAALAVLLILIAGGRYISPLATLPGSIRSMLNVTHDILQETQAMQVEVDRVQVGLESVRQQQVLLDEQTRLLDGVLAQLTAQEKLAATSRQLLAQILQSEQTTVALTAEANQRGAATRETLVANGVRLNRVSADAASIAESSSTVSAQLDSLVSNMETIQDAMAPVGRLKRAASDVLDRASSWLESLVTFFHG